MTLINKITIWSCIPTFSSQIKAFMMQSGIRAASESDVTSLSNEHALDFDHETLIGKDAYMYVYYQNGLRF